MYGCLVGVLFVSGWGWVRLLLAYETIQRLERQLAVVQGGLVNHEGRITTLEQALNGGRPNPLPKAPTFQDIMCSDASRTKRPSISGRQP